MYVYTYIISITYKRIKNQEVKRVRKKTIRIYNNCGDRERERKKKKRRNLDSY